MYIGFYLIKKIFDKKNYPHTSCVDYFNQYQNSLRKILFFFFWFSKIFIYRKNI